MQFYQKSKKFRVCFEFEENFKLSIEDFFFAVFGQFFNQNQVEGLAITDVSKNGSPLE